MSNYHVPVMLQECIDGLQINPKGTYVDVTYGGGGHSQALLDQLDEDGVLIVFDQDADAIKIRIDDQRMWCYESNFMDLEYCCYYHTVGKVDGVLADLGVSSHHLDVKDRSCSFRFGQSDLNMRMNTDAYFTAITVLNIYDHPKLAKVLQSNSEREKVSIMANDIINNRTVRKIETTED